MGNSTTTLQSCIDFASTIGDLTPTMPAGGFTNLLALTIANDVMNEFLSQRLNWKFNRLVVPPFLTISWQQDYASVNQTNIGWLEHACAVDINNPSLPKPIGWPTVVRDLERTSTQTGMPEKICWLPNDQLIQGTWPGVGVVYTNPLGAVYGPNNSSTNILDANGNILVLTTYGTTGNLAPVAPVASLPGVTVADGTCVWTVANPKAQGMRISPVPSQSGTVYQLNVIAQAKPLLFTSVGQTIDPIPDDYATYFRTGFIAYCYRHSTAPAVKQKFQEMKRDWEQSMAEARGQADRETDDAGFVPARGIMAETANLSLGPAWPFGSGFFG